MTPKADRKGIIACLRKPWVMTIGGLILGGLGALIFVILINYVIQPQMSVETRDIYEVRGDRFNVWYHEGSSERERYTDLLARLEESLDDLVDRLEVDPSQIPMPIDVMLHDNPGQMQMSIVRRKSLNATYTFYSVVDLLAGEDPYARLAEFVLAFGWGECFSQLLYAGTTMVVAEPDRSFHSAVAAAPERLRYSFEELLQLDAAGHFAPTLFQQFGSPYSARMALGSLEGVAVFYSFFSEGGGLGAQEDLASLQAASLIQYLIDCNGGIDVLKSVWGPGTSQAIFGRLVCGSIDGLSQEWLEYASQVGGASAEYDYYRALYSFEAGEFEEAHRLTSAWRAREVNDEEAFLAVRCALAIGEFEEAVEWIEAQSWATGQPVDWANLFRGWGRAEDDGVYIFGSPSIGDLTGYLGEAQAVLTWTATELGIDPDRLPKRVTIFVYEDKADRDVGRLLTPHVDTYRTTWHVVAGGEIGAILAATLPSYIFEISTASNQLRTGLATALTTEYEDLVQAGCEILDAGSWTPLWQLGFGGATPHLFETQTGLMIRYLLETEGFELIHALWRETARLGGAMSLDSALSELADTSKREIEQSLLNSVLVCD